jgi:hypothetical protein
MRSSNCGEVLGYGLSAPWRRGLARCRLAAYSLRSVAVESTFAEECRSRSSSEYSTCARAMLHARHTARLMPRLHVCMLRVTSRQPMSCCKLHAECDVARRKKKTPQDDDA